MTVKKNNDKVKLVKFPTTQGEGYRAGDTYYLYLRMPVKDITSHLRSALGLPATPLLHNQTASFRKWAQANNTPVPKDTEKLYNYVVTVGDAELPTVWPSRSYVRKNRSLSPSTMERYLPRVVYPIGTSTMCRFGHMKTVAKNGARENCNRCSWWRHQGIDLSIYTPTHCLKGHALKNNRWLSERRGNVSEHCVKCTNKKIMDTFGYKPSN